MNKIITIALLNLKLWLKSPNAIISAIIPPLGMVLLLAILSISVTKQPVALVVEDQGPYASKMEKIISADQEAYMLKITNLANAQHLLENQEVAAIIVIPYTFDANLQQNTKASIILNINNIDIDFSDDIRRSIDRSIAEFNAPQLGQLGEINGSPSSISNLPNLPNPYLINIDEYNLRKTNVDFIHYQLIPAFILLILSLGLVGTALLCANDIEIKISKYIITSPTTDWELIIGRLLGGFLITTIIVLPVFIVTYLAGMISIPSITHIPSLIILLLVTILCANGLGAIIGTTIKGAHNISLVCVILSTYLFFLGGGFTTIAFLPNWIQAISSINPMRYSIDGLRQILFYPNLSGVNFDIFIVFLTALISVILGALFMRRSLEE